MKENYNSRQRKIYQDYNSYSTDSLLDMVNNRRNYFPAVIEIINDILSERNVRSASFEPVRNKTGRETFLVEERLNSEEEIKLFVKELRDKSDTDLSDIITRYNSYKPETVRAALFVSVERGLLSYEVREELLFQTGKNLNTNKKPVAGVKNYWEENNAFVKYVSGYPDEEIYGLIDDPGGIVIDVYHAILVTAKERELISDDEFSEFFRAALEALRSGEELEKQEIKEFFGESLPEEFENETALAAEMEKFWICPSCNETVGMEFGVCWNCQTGIPEVVRHPGREEVIKEIKTNTSFNPVRSGLGFIAGGLILGLINYFVKSWHNHYVGSAIIVAGGIILVIFGLSQKSGKEK